MATPPLQTYGKCFESVESYSGAESKCISCGDRHSVARQAFGNAAAQVRMKGWRRGSDGSPWLRTLYVQRIGLVPRSLTGYGKAAREGG